jgi:sulfur carrier protein ThiS
MVKLVYRSKEYLVPAGMTLRDALKKIGVSSEAVLAVLDGQLVTDDAILQAGTTVKLVAVISGGARGRAPGMLAR